MVSSEDYYTSHMEQTEISAQLLQPDVYIRYYISKLYHSGGDGGSASQGLYPLARDSLNYSHRCNDPPCFRLLKPQLPDGFMGVDRC